MPPSISISYPYQQMMAQWLRKWWQRSRTDRHAAVTTTPSVLIPRHSAVRVVQPSSSLPEPFRTRIAPWKTVPNLIGSGTIRRNEAVGCSSNAASTRNDVGTWCSWAIRPYTFLKLIQATGMSSAAFNPGWSLWCSARRHNRKYYTNSILFTPHTASGNVFVKQGIHPWSKNVGNTFPGRIKAYLSMVYDIQINGTPPDPVLIRAISDSVHWAEFLQEPTAERQTQYLRWGWCRRSTDRRPIFQLQISAYRATSEWIIIRIPPVTDNPVFSRFSHVELTNSDIKTSVTGDGINIKQDNGRVENSIFEETRCWYGRDRLWWCSGMQKQYYTWLGR